MKNEAIPERFLGEHTLAGEDATLAFAADFAVALSRPALVLLEGELGAGKTRFAKGIGVGLGIDPAQITSPTFTLMHEHTTLTGATLVHVDAYRLDPEDDDDPTIDVVTDRLFTHAHAVCVIEWPSKVEDQLRAIGFEGTTVRVELWHAGATSRTARISML